ncbi:MAG: MurR/RpiR family transcriptional regulator [Actinobacteria bacterium]|nr:MurR/RpiR family transcriptional regulator [Actinomycetota bacterium]
MPVTDEVHALRERLRRDYDHFSPAQQALARYVADHIGDLPLMSAHEVARAAHCSPATVVRFAQALGFGGYPELQQLVRRTQRPWLPPPRQARSLGVFGGGDGVQAALDAERHALEDAADRLGQRGLAPLAQALVGRQPVLVAGDGHARAVINVLADRLARLGMPVVGITGLEPADRAWLGSIDRRSGVVAIGIGREARVAHAAAHAGQEAGASVVALVDSSLSPLARLNLARVVPADVRGGAPSLVAMVAVAQALAAAVEGVRRAPGAADTASQELSAVGA